MPLTVLSVAYPLAQVSPGTAGGAEQVLLTLDRGIVHSGHRSIVLAAAGSRCCGLLLPVTIPAGELHPLARQQARESFRQAIGEAVKAHSPDIVHMHGIDFYDYLPDLEIPVIITLHLPLTWYPPAALRNKRGNLTFISVSQHQATTAPAGVHIDEIVPNGVDLAEFSPSRRKGDYALVIGRICPEKGIPLAIHAAELAGVQLLLAGNVFEYPEHRDYFEKEVRPRLGPQVRLIGHVGGQRKAHLLAGARCVLIPSQAEETSSLVAMEAMASGTAVIAWRNGALCEIVAHGRTGWLVSSVEEMAAAIDRVAEIDPQECRREAEARFSCDRMVFRYLNLYRRISVTRSELKLEAA
jgi:glycosyltransferase involved in cell wall biosynthesis